MTLKINIKQTRATLAGDINSLNLHVNLLLYSFEVPLMLHTRFEPNILPISCSEGNIDFAVFVLRYIRISTSFIWPCCLMSACSHFQV